MDMSMSDIFGPLRQSLTQAVQLSLLIMLQILIILYRPDIVDKPNRVNPVQPSEIRKIYDYVIIGAGSAGSVVANRLSENGNWTVLLLEAGPDEPLLSDLPIEYQSLQNTSINWQFSSEPSNSYCLSSENGQCPYPRGKALGGTSVINAMLYVRGNKRDFDRWAADGNPGWDYESVLPYFKKSEDIRIPEYVDSPYHQTGGYLTVERYKFRTLVTSYVVKANEEAGLNLVDYNGADQIGVAYGSATVRNGLRCSTAKAFLRSASKRKNLDVSINSMVDRILIGKYCSQPMDGLTRNVNKTKGEDESTKTAYGVEFHIGWRSFKVEARREVILSAGTIQSPQLLMISGVGPKQHLEEIGINVILDAPGVGQNLQDHVGMSTPLYFVDLPSNYTDELSSDEEPPLMVAVNSQEAITPQSIKQFIVNHQGPLYVMPLCEAVSFNNTKYQNSSEHYPDMEIIWTTATVAMDNGASHVLYMGIPVFLRPRSRGYIKLRSNNSSANPIIVLNYFNDTRDLDGLIQGAKMVHSLKDTRIMRELNATAFPTTVPGCAKYQLESDDYWRCQARYTTSAGVHACSTCRMGPANDTMAVVDSRLRVHGIKKLRVVDASIMPYITAGNINAPTIMIAEKAADMIKEDSI